MFLMFVTTPALAHVRYLVPEDEAHTLLGADTSLILSPLLELSYVQLIFATAFVFLAVCLIVIKIPFFRKRFSIIDARANSYTVFLPWMLRLSVGIALIGSGVSGNLISPALSGFEFLSTIQILLGFLMITGFMVIPVAVGALFMYLYGVLHDPYMIGNLDFFVAVIGLLLLDNEKPGIDDMLGIPDISPFTSLKRWTPFVLRLGIGGAMVYLGLYEKIFNPHLSATVVEQFGLLHVVPVSTAMWVLGAGLVECVLGLALILGLYTRLVCAITFVVLSLSFFYFGEDVASHITLFGVLSVLFITQGGVLSVDKKEGRTNPEFI